MSLDLIEEAETAAKFLDYHKDKNPRGPLVATTLRAAIKEHKKNAGKGKGAMGLPFTVAGAAAQELAECAVDRDEVTREQMIEFLTNYYDEDDFWSMFGGPATDWFEEQAGGES